MIARSFSSLGAVVLVVAAVAAEPQAPVTVSPGSAAEVVQVSDRCPTFSWGFSPQVSSYHLAVYRVDETAPEQVRVVLSQELPGSASSWTPPLHRCLAAGATYAWRVGAARGEAEPVWSATAWFEVPALGTGEPPLVTAGAGGPPKGTATGEGASSPVPAQGRGTVAVQAPTATAVRALASYFSVGSGGTVTAGPVTATSFTGDGSGLSNLQPGNIAAGTAGINVSGTASNVTGLAAGALTFGGAGGGLAQDLSNLFWEDASNRLQLGGNLELPATAADGSRGMILVQGSRFLHAPGNGNTFLGLYAGSTPLSGTYNTAVGYAALEDVTAGLDNAAFGYRALEDNTTGRNNTAVGSGALQSNTTIHGSTAVGRDALQNQSFDPGVEWWSQNTAVGEMALYANNPTQVDPMNGFANTAIGYKSLRNNQTGSRNTALGGHSLFSNTVGEANVAVGHTAMRNNTTSSYNVAVGPWALYYQTFDNGGVPYLGENTAVGYLALYANEPTSSDNGGKNTAVGSLSLASNTIGSENTAVGRESLQNNTTASRNVAVGASALESQSFDNGGSEYEAANTAVGYAALASNEPVSATTGIYNTAVGGGALASNTTGSHNTALGVLAGFNLTTGDHNIHIGNQGVAGEGNTIRIGDSSQTRTFVAGIHGVEVASDGQAVYIDASGQLGTRVAAAPARSGHAADRDRADVAALQAALERHEITIEAQKRLIAELAERLARLEAALSRGQPE